MHVKKIVLKVKSLLKIEKHWEKIGSAINSIGTIPREGMIAGVLPTKLLFNSVQDYDDMFYKESDLSITLDVPVSIKTSVYSKTWPHLDVSNF